MTARLRKVLTNLHGNSPAVLYAWKRGAAREKLALALSCLFLTLPVWGIILFSLAFLFSMAIFFCLGYALPAAPFVAAMPSRYLTAPDLRNFLLLWAMCGLAWAWLAHPAASPLHTVKKRVEAHICRLLATWGFWVILALLTIQLDLNWAGLNSGYGDILGLLSFSDAYAYWADIRLLPDFGYWPWLSSRRPLAGALRTVTGLGGSHQGILFMQTLLLAVASWLAVRAVSRWKGIWAGAAFLAFCVVHAGAYTSSTLTETLGLLVALLAVACTAEGMRRRSFAALITGVGILWIALLIRMGAMFLPLCLGIYILCLALHRKKAFLRCCAGLVFVLLLGLGLSGICQKLYAHPGMTLGSNFAYTLYGLSMGSDWTAGTALAKGFQGTEQEFAKFLTGRAWQNIKTDPAPLLGSLRDDAKRYKKSFFTFSMGGAFGHPLPPHCLKIYIGLCLAGLLAAAWHKGRALLPELGFALSVLAGMFLSAPIIWTDGGARVLITGYPFVWIVLILFFTAPASVAAPSIVRGKDYGWTLVYGGILLVSSLIVPNFFPFSPVLPKSPDSEQLVISTDPMASILVYVAEDEQRRPTDIPAVSHATWEKALSVKLFPGAEAIPWPTPPFVYGFFIAKNDDKPVGTFGILTAADFALLRSSKQQQALAFLSPWPEVDNSLKAWLGPQSRINILSLFPSKDEQDGTFSSDRSK